MVDFKEQLQLVKSSKQVHSAWYSTTYPDVADSGMDPAMHYLRYGAAMGRNPGKGFDTRFYLETCPDAATSGLNPLVHYMLHGKDAGHAVKPGKAGADQRIAPIRTKLLSLGFTEEPLAELEALLAGDPDPATRVLAARELALWHMRDRTPEGYRLALDYIARARADAPSLEIRQRLAVAELLCHFFLAESAAGKATYERAALAGEVTPDVMLAWVNFQPEPEARITWINQMLARYNIPPVRLLPDDGRPAYDRLTSEGYLEPVLEGPKVTVLIAAYEAEEMLGTALRSLQEQTWKNLEIIVLDDCSPSPGTVEVAERFAALDPRIRVIRMAENGGAYVARNRGLDEATGDYVTIHDADDWSHPLKIETQVRFMEGHPKVMGCTSEQARCRADLTFSRWTGSGVLINRNVSSFLWRRQPVCEQLGYWDTVRFAADSEFIRRIQKVFGHKSVAVAPGGPYSFQRDSDSSIVADEVMGMNGFYFGVRKEYHDAQRFYHNSGGSLKYTNNAAMRPFAVPVMMLPDRAKYGKNMHFDKVYVGDFFGDGESIAIVEKQLKADKISGLTVALVESYRPDVDYADTPRLHESLRQEVDGKNVHVLVFGNEATCHEIHGGEGVAFNNRYAPVIVEGRKTDLV